MLRGTRIRETRPIPCVAANDARAVTLSFASERTIALIEA